MDAQLFGKISLTMTDGNNNKVSENLGYTQANVINDSVASAAINTFARGVNSLTQNTYSASTVTYEVDLDSAWVPEQSGY